MRQEQKQNLSSGWPCGSRINTCSKAKSHPRNLSIDEQFSPATQVLSISKLNITVLTAIRAGTRACGLHRPLTPPPGSQRCINSLGQRLLEPPALDEAQAGRAAATAKETLSAGLSAGLSAAPRASPPTNTSKCLPSTRGDE